MIKAVIFDLGGVYFTDGTKLGAGKLGKKYNVGADNVLKIVKTSSKLGTLYRRGEITVNQFWNEVKKELNIKADNKDLQKLWQTSYKPIKGTVGIVKQLKMKGVRLYYLSDNVKERVYDLERRYQFLKNFEGGVFSHKVHKTKLDGATIFKLAIKKTGQKPRNLIYIEDKEEYVKTAKRLGMNVIHFKSPKQLRQELSEYQVI